MNNIILIGMPTAGKSSAGVIIAKALGMKFMDTDILIQEEMGMKLSEIISSKGLDGFLKVENEVLSKIDADNCIIATGGSAVYGKDAMEHLKSIGRIVYLKISEDTLKLRLGDMDERGVVHRTGQTLHDLYTERAALYERYADITVGQNGGDFYVDELVRDVIAAL